eukprot:scaffold1151_cov355-Pavlova_lutheri.AAC.1
MPEGHPPLKNFIGVPIFLGPNLVGQVGFANRAQGWTEDDGRFLETWGSMLGALIVQFDDYLIGTKGQPEEVARSESRGESMATASMQLECNETGSRLGKRERHRSKCGRNSSGHPDNTTNVSNILDERYAHEALIQAHMVDSISDGIIIFDERLCIHFCNVGASTMLKFNDAKELVSCYPTFDQLLEGGLSRNASLNHFDLDQTLRMSSLLSTGVRFEAELKKAPTEAGTDL